LIRIKLPEASRIDNEFVGSRFSLERRFLARWQSRQAAIAGLLLVVDLSGALLQAPLFFLCVRPADRHILARSCASLW
jgi:hypothetical protein